MKTNEVFPSKYMKAEDLGEDETKIFTIRNVEMEELGQGTKKESKPVMTFREPNAKGLVVNKTNWAIIANFYGDDSDDWLGKKVALHAIEVESFGDVVRAIRVKTKAPAPVKPAPVMEEEPIFPDEDNLPDMHLQAGGVKTKKQPA